MSEQGAVRSTWITHAYQLLVVVPALAFLRSRCPDLRDEVLDPAVLSFAIAVAAVDLIPVPAWGGMQLSLSFPLLLGVAIIFDPPVAMLIALVGSVDPREFRREVAILKALYNRSQMAVSILAGSALLPSPRFARGRVVPAPPGDPRRRVGRIRRSTRGSSPGSKPSSATRRSGTSSVAMHGPAPYEFLLSYLGLGLFGAVIAQFYRAEGFWSVIVFLGPLVFARQMYFRSRALADRLAEQNEILGEQTRRLEDLLEKQHHTVDELRELNRMKGEFVAVVSHELRTPVTALLGYAKTLRQPEFAEDPKMRAEFLERMERQSERLLLLVDNLLTAANLESDQVRVRVGRVLFEDLVREVVESLGTRGEPRPRRHRRRAPGPDDRPAAALARPAEPRRQRDQVLARRLAVRARRVASTATTSCSRSATTGSGSSRRTRTASSTASIRWTRRARARSAAAGSGCRWSARCSRSSAARSRSTARPARGAGSPSACRSSTRGCTPRMTGRASSSRAANRRHAPRGTRRDPGDGESVASQIRSRRLRGSVGEGGLEPPRPCGHRNLNPARLPIPPLARGAAHRSSGLRATARRVAASGDG